MLHIQNSFRANTAYQRDTAPSETPANDEIRIDFANNSSIYAKNEVVKLVAIQVLLNPEFSVASERVLKLTKCNSEMFKMVSAFIVEKKHFFELITDDDMRPTIFEDLTKQLRLYHPTGCHDVIVRLEREMDYMSLEQAKKIVDEFSKIDCSSNEKPTAVKIAAKIVKFSKFASSTDEAELLLGTMRAYSIEQQQCEACLDKLQVELRSVNSIQKDLINHQIDLLNDDIMQCKNKISQLQQTFCKDLQTIRMSDLQELIKRDDQNDPELKEIIKAGNQKLEDYKQDLLDALRKSGARMDRSDLLEYLVGPKAFLLDSYQLIFDPSNNPTYPFVHSSRRGVHFGYRLENDGPMELEEEIRTDLRQHTNTSLFPPIVKERTFSKPISEKAKKMQADLLPILRRWMFASEEEVRKVKQELINHNDWGKYCIEPQHLRINETQNPTEMSTFRGKLTKFARPYEFVFKPTDFDMFFILPDGRVCPDKVGVHEILTDEARYYSSAMEVPR